MRIYTFSSSYIAYIIDTILHTICIYGEIFPQPQFQPPFNISFQILVIKYVHDFITCIFYTKINLHFTFCNYYICAYFENLYLVFCTDMHLFFIHILQMDALKEYYSSTKNNNQKKIRVSQVITYVLNVFLTYIFVLTAIRFLFIFRLSKL